MSYRSHCLLSVLADTLSLQCPSGHMLTCRTRRSPRRPRVNFPNSRSIRWSFFNPLCSLEARRRMSNPNPPIPTLHRYPSIPIRKANPILPKRIGSLVTRPLRSRCRSKEGKRSRNPNQGACNYQPRKPHWSMFTSGSDETSRSTVL